jgi:hypothetical protein
MDVQTTIQKDYSKNSEYINRQCSGIIEFSQVTIRFLSLGKTDSGLNIYAIPLGEKLGYGKKAKGSRFEDKDSETSFHATRHAPLPSPLAPPYLLPTIFIGNLSTLCCSRKLAKAFCCIQRE